MHTELLDTRRWRTRTGLSTEIFDWIEVFYNRTSPQQSWKCSPRSPMRSSMPRHQRRLALATRVQCQGTDQVLLVEELGA